MRDDKDLSTEKEKEQNDIHYEPPVLTKHQNLKELTRDIDDPFISVP